MTQVTYNQRIESLQQQCRHLATYVRRETDDPEIRGLQHKLVGKFSPTDFDSKHAICLVARNGKGLEGAVTIKRVAYEDGMEVAYDGRDNYINKIEFLATMQQGSSRLAAALAAQAMLHVGGTQLFLAEVDNTKAAKVFEYLEFSRICKAAGKIRYGYLLTDHAWSPPIRRPQIHGDREHYLNRLPFEEQQYYNRLQEQSGFDITRLVTEQWTTYQRYGNHFFIMVTFGELADTGQAALKTDLFDLADGGHVGYADVVVSHESDYALQDNAVTSFRSAIPSSATNFLQSFPPLRLGLANEIRTGWPHREGICVQLHYRRAGIGQTLERITGDVCKLVFPGIDRLGVIFPLHNLKAYEFHLQCAAHIVHDPLYCLAYHLNDINRPLIAIRYGL